MDPKVLFEILTNKAMQHFFPVMGNEEFPLTKELLDSIIEKVTVFATDTIQAIATAVAPSTNEG